MIDKNILIIYSSPHDTGRTKKLLDSFLVPFCMHDADWSIDILDCYKKMPKPCTDCGFCKNNQACINNDLDDFDEKYRKADVIVVASPVYNFSFPSPLKALLDRTQRYFSARFSLGVNPPIEKHKTAVLLMCMGSADARGEGIPEYQLERAFTVMNTTLDYKLFWRETDSGNKSGERELLKARDIALEIITKTC